MLNLITLEEPTAGLNNTDPSYEIQDNQAQKLENFRLGLHSIETIRPSNLPYGFDEPSRGGKIVDDVLIYRPRVGDPYIMFAYNGKVYKTQNVYQPPETINYNGTIGARIRLLQFNDYVYIFNGVDANKKFDGTNVFDFGIDAPMIAPVKLAGTGTEARTYYYTWYNERDKTESNPSPALVTTGNTNMSIRVRGSADAQVTHVRLYRTGLGITVPRLCKEVANTGGGNITIADDSSNPDVARAQRVSLDNDKPPILADGMFHNNRLFAWGGKTDDGKDNLDTLWVSNEYKPQYMPRVPFIDQTEAATGGPIEINPGDGGRITQFVAWGGAGICFKENFAYRIQETEVGFYTYQSMNIPGCIGRNTAQLTPWGLIWLSPDGVMQLDFNEQVTFIGEPVQYSTRRIIGDDRVTAIYVDGLYILSYEEVVTNEWKTLFYGVQGGWQGPHSLSYSCYYIDRDGKLYGGTPGYVSIVGIVETRFHIRGRHPDYEVYDKAIPLAYQTKAFEFTPGRYSRIRYVNVIGRSIPRDNNPPNLTLNIYDEQQKLLSSTVFKYPYDGNVQVGIDSSAQGQFLSLEIKGESHRPISISKLQVAVEQGATI